MGLGAWTVVLWWRVGREACTLKLVGGGQLVRAQGGAGLGVQALAGLC